MKIRQIVSAASSWKAFPLKRLPTLTLEEYVIGTKKPTFCAFVEAKTRLWANIFGATSFKFGVYYGHTKTDPKVKYRFAHKYGQSVEEAFDTVKTALLDLIKAGKSLRFGDIDENPLSQLFKAKILSLYFPDKYLNVCSAEHIEELSEELGLPSDTFVSEQQHQLRQAASENPITRNWSNPKVMTFLYNTFIPRPNKPAHLKTVQNRRHAKIDIEDLLEKRKRIGEMSGDSPLTGNESGWSGSVSRNPASKTAGIRRRVVMTFSPTPPKPRAGSLR